jgi:hypothetical protein
MAVKPPSSLAGASSAAQRLGTFTSVIHTLRTNLTHTLRIPGISSLRCSKIEYKKDITNEGPKLGAGRVVSGSVLPFLKRSPPTHIRLVIAGTAPVGRMRLSVIKLLRVLSGLNSSIKMSSSRRSIWRHQRLQLTNRLPRWTRRVPQPGARFWNGRARRLLNSVPPRGCRRGPAAGVAGQPSYD